MGDSRQTHFAIRTLGALSFLSRQLVGEASTGSANCRVAVRLRRVRMANAFASATREWHDDNLKREKAEEARCVVRKDNISQAFDRSVQRKRSSRIKRIVAACGVVLR